MSSSILEVSVVLIMIVMIFGTILTSVENSTEKVIAAENSAARASIPQEEALQTSTPNNGEVTPAAITIPMTPIEPTPNENSDPSL